MQLEEPELSMLRAIAADNTGESSVIAQNILCFGYGECSNTSSQAQSRLKRKRDYSTMINKKISIEKNVIVNPVPANEDVNINLSGVNISNCKVQIIDMLGKKLVEKRLVSQSQRIKTSHLKEGIYLLQVLQEDNPIFDKKLIIKH